jgi:MFS family permease
MAHRCTAIPSAWPVPPGTERATERDPYAALRSRDYRLFLGGRFLSVIGAQMLAVAIGWELYERTHSAMALGFVGLVQVAPIYFLVLPAGHAADRFDRRIVAMLSLALLIATSLGLAAISYAQAPVGLVYVCLFFVGVALAFHRPAAAALLPQLVPPEDFTNAVTWSSTGWQAASVIGPALGGGLIALAHRAGPVYLADAVLMTCFMVCILAVRGRSAPRVTEPATAKSLLAGVHFVRHEQVIFGAITLDLFAVFFGGAMTLLPVFAKDILHVGPDGFGLLRAAPAIGAVIIAFAIAHGPPLKNAGRMVLWSVAGFGITTIIFGVSRWYPLSLAMMIAAGAFDMVSVVIRQTLVQVRTPDVMRGRVSAVNSLFIDTSNELGGFESGATAAWFGPVWSVVGGGIATLLVVGAVARWWPELRDLTTLEGPDPPPASGERT